ncbi:hypothetical protein [Horticoccus sp. 23ND18S-11]|uniref:hypothetical protein n=1 Tax=Horticoccus sp. 23ND18S-11 TaxID=3391832 RepID=UPI0039C948FB
MNDERYVPSALDYIDWVVMFVSGAVAIGYAVAKTPVAFWLPAWFVQAVAFCYAVSRKDGAHWPSTVFGFCEGLYIVSVISLFASKRVSFASLTQLLLGLLFVHGILYLIAAKRFLIRRGYLKPKNA